MEGLVQLLALLRSLTASRNQLALENAALRHQLAVLKRSVKRSRVTDSDRVFWILMRRFLKDWKGVLGVCATVHAKGADRAARDVAVSQPAGDVV